jgi:hypothetical protein
MLSKEKQREAAHKAAEAALQDMREMLPADQIEEGYDLTDLPTGDILVECGHDVKFAIDQDGEWQCYIGPSGDEIRNEPSESELERRADNVGVPFWEQI